MMTWEAGISNIKKKIVSLVSVFNAVAYKINNTVVPGVLLVL